MNIKVLTATVCMIFLTACNQSPVEPPTGNTPDFTPPTEILSPTSEIIPTSTPQPTASPTKNTTNTPKTHQECVKMFCGHLNGSALNICGQQNCNKDGIPIYPWE